MSSLIEPKISQVEVATGATVSLLAIYEREKKKLPRPLLRHFVISIS